jgi:hypothetical protein
MMSGIDLLVGLWPTKQYCFYKQYLLEALCRQGTCCRAVDTRYAGSGQPTQTSLSWRVSLNRYPTLNPSSDGTYLAATLRQHSISVRGARTHNLKNIDLEADFATYGNNVADDKTVTENDQTQELKDEQGTK